MKGGVSIVTISIVFTQVKKLRIKKGGSYG
jgi:hypothetical protein